MQGTKEENRKLHSFEIADKLDYDSLVESLEVNNVKQAVGDTSSKTHGQLERREVLLGTRF